MDSKVVFFIRAYNDLDNIVPVIYATCNNGGCDVQVVITGSKSLIGDYRIQLIKSKFDIEVTTLSAYIPNFFKATIQSKFDFKIIKEKIAITLTKFKLFNYQLNEPELSSFLIVDGFFKKLVKGHKQVVFCFDWTSNTFVKLLCKRASQESIKTIALPHGAAPYINKLDTISAVNFSGKDKSNLVNIFDYFVVPNKSIVEHRYNNVKKEKLRVLGLIRYSHQWKQIHDVLIDSSIFSKLKGSLNVLLFMRDTNYSIHFEEIKRTIDLICQHSDVNLVIKYHTRLSNLSIKKDKLDTYLKKYNNLRLAFDDITSPQLIKWSDVVLDLGTTAAFEGILENKSLICPEYLHPNRTVTAHYFPGAVANTRDDLFNLIEKSRGDKNFRSYNEDEKQQFLKEIIGSTDRNLMDDYSDFIQDVLQESITKTN